MPGTRDRSADAENSKRRGRIGAGGRLFPAELNASTAPNLAAAKQQVLQIMDDYNALFIMGAFPAIWMILTMGVGATGGVRATRTATRTPLARGGGRSGSAPPSPPAQQPQQQQPSTSTLPESTGASPRGSSFQAASARTARSTVTAIRSDVGESEAYKEALRRGELGLERPQGSNVPGRADFITARPATGGQWEIVVTDVKTSTTGKFPAPGTSMPTPLGAQIRSAIGQGRLNVGNPAVEAQIRAALDQGRVVFRQVNVNYSPAGGGSMTGF